MAAAQDGVIPYFQNEIKNAKILVVGAGGIGCEILKNLVLSGFSDIDIIDLDTIDLSNLNRQFLFHREHVGKSKAKIACESALTFNPDVKIQSHHDSIMSTDYGINYFKKFNVVLNALDNRAARNHVNRMCLNADVPLIESGTAGYNGQVELIKKGLTQCYECTPKAAQKSFPGCTIRNTPSEPIHCIVWAKHLFNQLFGETTDDEDISPDVADPEAKDNKNGDGDGNGDSQKANEPADTGNVVRVSTRQWAKDVSYDPIVLFNKFFHDDINYLLSMSNLWKSRKPPTPIKWETISPKECDSKNLPTQYHKIWTLEECASVFANCLNTLRGSLEQMGDNDFLVWDKDDQPAMNFVAACANIRAYIFQIAQKSRFEVKSMAGNIIPAIATTNAITAGIVVLHAFKILKGQFDKCQSVYMRLRENPRQQVVIPEKTIEKPNPNCYVCAVDPAITIRIDTNRMRIKDFRDDVLIKGLNMLNPDVIVDAKGIVVISSEEGETECNEEKTLHEMGIVDGVLLKCDDFFQNYELGIVVVHFDAEREDPTFEILATKEQLEKKNKEPENVVVNSKNDDGPSTSKKAYSTELVDDDDDDLILLEEDDESANNKEKSSSNSNTDKEVKGGKRKPDLSDGVEDIELVDSDDEGPTVRKRTRLADPKE